MSAIAIKNNQQIPVSSIPLVDYHDFLIFNTSLLKLEENHCVNYFGIPKNNTIQLFCCVANDNNQNILISSSIIDKDKPYPSFSEQHVAFEKFEREIHENFGINYTNHPWLKPVRYAYDRQNKSNTITNYPFFKIDSEELHEVGVGPIHAGIIEPGHFRFLCNGEQILHLEIQLGYQHRGIEKLFLNKKRLVERNTLAENIAGDSVIGHTTAFVNLWESLCKFEPSDDILLSRIIALELERIAVHTGDLSGMCTDIAYQLGSSVFGRLRTPIINFFQQWCGNRLGKSLVRVGNNNFPFTNELRTKLIAVLDKFEPDFDEMCKETFHAPTVLGRLEKTGIITNQLGKEIGLVGMAARMTNINRDIRSSHPFGYYTLLAHQPILKGHGDVQSRGQIRREEVKQSINYIRNLLNNIPLKQKEVTTNLQLTPSSFAISLIESWRGEICHCAITDENGELLHYKIKDPSFHNWLAVAMSVRNNEISDFPIGNKSFDLSYCGHDL